MSAAVRTVLGARLLPEGHPLTPMGVADPLDRTQPDEDDRPHADGGQVLSPAGHPISLGSRGQSPDGVAIVEFEIELMMRISYTLRLQEESPGRCEFRHGEAHVVNASCGGLRVVVGRHAPSSFRWVPHRCGGNQGLASGFGFSE